MKKSLIIAAMLILVAAMNGYAGGGSEQIRIATGEVGGKYNLEGIALAERFQSVVDLPVSTITTAGSLKNIDLINAGKAEFAIVQNDMADHAWHANYLFKGKRKTGFAAVTALYMEPCQIVADPASGIKSIADFKGKRVSIGSKGSGTEVNARQILDLYGIDLKDVVVSNLGFTDSANSLKVGKIDAFFCVAGLPTPVIADLAKEKAIIFLEIDDDHAAQIMQYHPYYIKSTVSSGTYQGQSADVKTLSLKAVLVASWKVSEDVVYQVTKKIREDQVELNKETLKAPERFNWLRFNDGVTIPFHPGAGRYYTEINQFPVQTPPRNKPAE